MSLLTKYSSIILVILLSFFTIQPLFAQGFFKVHDDTQVARVYEMKTALADGMFPVRWVPDLGYNYGYPIFNFYGPLAYYVGGFFNLLGFDSLVATKIMIGLGTLIAGIFMYLLAKEFWGRIGGIVSAILYMYAPYHAINIYVRGAIGELWAYGLLPLIFYALYKIFVSFENESVNVAAKSKIKSQRSKMQTKDQKFIWFWISVAALGYAGIIVSHNLTAMMVTPFLFVFAVGLYIAVRFRAGIRTSYFILLSLLFGIVLATFYWLPVLFEMQYTNVLSVVGGGSDYKDHFVCVSQLWDSQWGFAGSAPGCLDGMSYKLGKLHILLALLSLIPLFLYRSQKKIFYAIIISLTGTVLALFLLLDYSKIIWDAIPHMAFLQFPWRFMVLVFFGMSLLGGAILLILDKKPMLQAILGIIIVAAVIVMNAKLFLPDKIDTRTVEAMTSKSELSWRVSKISDEYMPKGFQKPRTEKAVPEKKLSEHKDIKISNYVEKTQIISADISVAKQTELLVNLAYFPGWHVYIDNQQQEFKFFKKGLLVTIPEGNHKLELRFSQTTVEIIGNVVTLAGVFILIAGIILSRKADKRG